MKERVRLVRHKSAYVLPTESLAQFDEDLNGVTKALKPQNRIEQIYSDDFAHSNREVQRYRRASSSFVRMVIPEVLYDTLTRELNACDSREALLLVDGWRRDDSGAKAQVSEILKAHGLSEQALEGEAVRRCLPQLMLVSQLTASAVSRRDKALAGVALVREMEARQAQNAVNHKKVAQIEHAPLVLRPVKHG
jgi:hypothetical protein